MSGFNIHTGLPTMHGGITGHGLSQKQIHGLEDYASMGITAALRGRGYGSMPHNMHMMGSHSLGGYLLGGAGYRKKGKGKKFSTTAFNVSETTNVKEVRAAAKRLEAERNKAVKRSPAYKAHVKQYQNMLKDIARNRLEGLTAEESMAIEVAIRNGATDQIPFLIADRNQHIRMLKAKHFPMWAAKEYTFDLHKSKKDREFHMSPYDSGMMGIEAAPSAPLQLGYDAYSSIPRGVYSSDQEPSYSSSPRGYRDVRRDNAAFARDVKKSRALMFQLD